MNKQPTDAETSTQASSTLPDIVPREQWRKARIDLLEKEKELTHKRDEVDAARQRRPTVEVDDV